MLRSGWNHRYGPYPKKKGKRRTHSKEQGFLESYDWLKWKITHLGDFSFRRPCLDR